MPQISWENEYLGVVKPLNLQGFSDCSLLYPMGTPMRSIPSAPGTTSRPCRRTSAMPRRPLRWIFTATVPTKCGRPAPTGCRHSSPATPGRSICPHSTLRVKIRVKPDMVPENVTFQTTQARYSTESKRNPHFSVWISWWTIQDSNL